MSWIHDVPPESAPAAVEALYARLRARSSRGRVSHVWRVIAGDPALLESLLAQARVLLDEPAPLTGAQAELIAVVVSATNGSGYCVAHHGPRLARALADAPLARDVARDYREANLTARDRVMLDLAVALTCEPSERTAEDIERVREYGFDDASILRTVAIAAYFNQVNRLVHTLGVALEDDVEPWEFGTQR